MSTETVSRSKRWREIRADRAAADPEFEAGVTREREHVDREIEAYERSLSELRRARALTQTTLAQVMGVSQAQVSRIENEADLYLSTLQNYIDALGGRLELVGVFDDERVSLRLSDIVPSEA